MAGNDVEWRLSGGAANTDPNASLGGNMSTAGGGELQSLESTLTSTQTAGQLHLLVDTARIGDGDDVHLGKWLVMLTGVASLGVGRVVDFDSASGTYSLDRDMPVAAALGDTYHLFTPQNLFDNATAAECSTGEEDYRMIYMRNLTGVTLTTAVVYVVPLDEGPCTLEVMPNQATGQPSLTISPDTVSPLDSNGFVQGTGFTTRNTFGRDARPVEPENGAPAGGITSFTNNNQAAIWVKRTTPPDSEVRRRCAFMIVLSTDVSGQDPDPLTSAAIVAFELDGITPSISLAPDRFVHVAGGTRITGTLTAQETGQGVGPGRDVTLTVDGLGTLTGDANPQTDSDGAAAATYAAPTDPAEEGNTADVEFNVGDGEEVL